MYREQSSNDIDVYTIKSNFLFYFCPAFAPKATAIISFLDILL